MMYVIDKGEQKCCSFCDREVANSSIICGLCREYKGIMTIAEWEAYTGKVW